MHWLCGLLAANENLLQLHVQLELKRDYELDETPHNEKQFLEAFAQLRGVKDVRFTGSLENVEYASYVASCMRQEKGWVDVTRALLEEVT